MGANSSEFDNFIIKSKSQPITLTNPNFIFVGPFELFESKGGVRRATEQKP
jgi:hypothetical protein